MIKEGGNTVEVQSLTESFLREVVYKLTASVADVIERKDNGKFEVHFSQGQLTRIRKDVTI